jgi:hypothetical protein
MKSQRLNYFFWQSLLLTTSVVCVIEPLSVVAVPIVAAEIPICDQHVFSNKLGNCGWDC